MHVWTDGLKFLLVCAECVEDLASIKLPIKSYSLPSLSSNEGLSVFLLRGIGAVSTTFPVQPPRA